MVKTIGEQVVERIETLIARAKEVLDSHKPNPDFVIGFPTLNTGKFISWRSAAENLIVNVAGENSIYHRNFSNSVNKGYCEDVEAGVGILNSLKEDIELGFLNNIRELVSAEVFSDFLEMAEHLLKSGYKDAAASLVGAVLENSLKRLAISNNIKVNKSDDIGSVNTKLADAEVYNRLVQKQVQAWKAIRDSADHGRFDDYSKEDVQSMINGVLRFIAENR